MNLTLLLIIIAAVAVASVGVYGLTSSRNFVRQLLSLEVVFNAIILLIAVMLASSPGVATILLVILVLIVSGEVVVIMALVISAYRSGKSLESDILGEEGV
ncbi:MAG: NADH-quinone oxidoreductase subunit K [Thermoprotei archaeon]|nr:NADH-quinone oxidoreductase subunit K [Thermoprotei archaeon]